MKTPPNFVIRYGETQGANAIGAYGHDYFGTGHCPPGWDDKY